MNPIHWAFDKLYPLIRFIYEKVQGHPWFHEITPQLWLGGAPTYERDYAFLNSAHINAIVDMRAERSGDQSFFDDNGIDYQRVPVLDVMVPTNADFDQGVAFIRQHVENNDIVLVHCAKGRGRSATMLAAYLMKYEGCSYQEAKDLLSSKRSLVQLQGRHERALETWIRLQEIGAKQANSDKSTG